MTWFDKKPTIALAPMADYTNGSFCRVCREVESAGNPLRLPATSPLERGRGFVVFREMVSAEAIVRGNEKTLKMCEFDEIERPIVLQLFGADPKVIVEAAKILLGTYTPQTLLKGGVIARPDGIDINMGCPVPKIAKKGHAGADLMKDHTRACDIVKALKNANLGLPAQAGVPVSVKTRLGWYKDDVVLEFAQKLEQAGVDALTIHGRTQVQGYSGKANWERIAEVKDKVKVPIIANGDIKTAEDISRCLQITGADGVMIGRGALGNPWILSGFPDNPDLQIPMNERIKVILRHAELQVEQYGERGLINLRKHLPFYFKGIDGVKEIRSELVQVNSLEGLKNILQKIKKPS